MKPTLTQVLDKAQELIDSGKYRQIQGNFTDYGCGRCYIGLLAEAAAECGLNVPYLGLALTRTGWLTTLGLKRLLYNDCEWLKEEGTPFFKLWGKNDNAGWSYQQIQDWLVAKNEAAKRTTAQNSLRKLSLPTKTVKTKPLKVVKLVAA